MRKVITSLESCLFMEVSNERESLGKFIMSLLLTNALSRYSFDVCGVPTKKCFENYIVRNHVFRLIACASEGWKA